MPWKRFVFYTLVGGLVLFASGALLTGNRAGYGNHRSHYNKILSQKLGWETSRLDHREFLRQAERYPDSVLPLLSDPSARMREVARQIFRNSHAASSLTDTALDTMTAELTNRSEFHANDLVEILVRNGDRGILRLCSLYHREVRVRPDVQQAICDEVYRDSYFTVHPPSAFVRGLLNVVSDETAGIGNRCLAIEAICHALKRTDEKKEPEYEKFYSDLLDLLKKAPESLTVTMKIIQESLDAQDEITRVKNSREDNSWDQFLPIKDGGNEAIAALADQKDWLRVVIAAQTLARAKISDAIPSLEKVAGHHWYEPVRKTALRAIQIIHDQAPQDPLSKTPFLDLILKERLEQNSALPASFIPPEKSWSEKISDLVKPIQEDYFWHFQPSVNEVAVFRPGRIPVYIDIENLGSHMRVKHATRFAGGKMLGYDEGEFGSGTVFYKRNEIPVFFPTENVMGFVKMTFGLVVVCETPGPGDGILYLAKQNSFGKVELTRFQRLPGSPFTHELRPNGDLLVYCDGGNVIISNEGIIRMANDGDYPTGRPRR